MKLYILAGAKTPTIINILDKYNYRMHGSDDLSEGLEQLSMIDSADILVMFDEALFRDGNLLDYREVFETLDTFNAVNKDMEILMITKDKDIYDAFAESMVSNSKARCNLVHQLNSKVIDECIKNTYQEKEQEKPQQETAVTIQSVVEEPALEPVPISEPEPEPQPAPEPPKPKVPKQKPPKSKKEKQKKINLGDLIKNNKIIVVTGPHNSGVSSTAVGLAKTFADDGVETILVDGDIYYKGANKYYDILDNGASKTQQTGFRAAVESVDLIDESYIEIDSNLFLLGTCSTVKFSYLEDLYNECEANIADLANILANDFRVVLIHMPIELLLKCNSLVRYAEHVIFCTHCTINGIMDTVRYLATSNVENDRSLHQTVSILQRKTDYILTDYTPNEIEPDMWLQWLMDYCNEANLHQYVLGVINHNDEYDYFKDVKIIPTEFDDNKNLFHVMLERLLGL